MFLAHIGTTLQIALLGAGLVVFHYGHKEVSKSMKLASLVMILGGLLGLACNAYWYMHLDKEGMWKDPRAMFHSMMQDDNMPAKR